MYDFLYLCRYLDDIESLACRIDEVPPPGSPFVLFKLLARRGVRRTSRKGGGKRVVCIRNPDSRKGEYFVSCAALFLDACYLRECIMMPFQHAVRRTPQV